MYMFESKFIYCWLCVFLVLLCFSSYTEASTKVELNTTVQQKLNNFENWQAKFTQLKLQLAEKRLGSCTKGDLNCAERVISESAEMFELLHYATEKWGELHTTSKTIVDNFVDMEVPNHAFETREQFYTYLFLLESVHERNMSIATIIAYLKGQLGILNNYHHYYATQELIASAASEQQDSLFKIKQLVKQQVRYETRLLKSLKL